MSYAGIKMFAGQSDEQLASQKIVNQRDSQRTGLWAVSVAVVELLSRSRLFATPWTVAHQVPLSFTISQSLLKLISIKSFFLELFFHSSPVTYWTPTDLGGSSSSIISFCFFIQFVRFLRQTY